MRVVMKPPKLVPPDGGGCDFVDFGKCEFGIRYYFCFALVVNIHNCIQVRDESLGSEAIDCYFLAFHLQNRTHNLPVLQFFLFLIIQIL